MTPYQTHARIRRRAMVLLCRRLLSATDLAVLQAMLDHACPRGRLAFDTTYRWLHQVTGLCNQHIADAVRRLDAYRLVCKVRNGRVVGRRYRQYPNRYFITLSESTDQRDSPISKILSPYWAARMAQKRAAKRRAQQSGIEGDGDAWLPPSLRAVIVQGAAAVSA